MYSKLLDITPSVPTELQSIVFFITNFPLSFLSKKLIYVSYLLNNNFFYLLYFIRNK